MKSFTAEDSSPQTAFDASLNQLQRLALLYYSQKISGISMPYINASLLHIAKAASKEMESRD